MNELSYYYQYTVGTIIFLFGLWICYRNGDLRPSRWEDRRFLFWCVFGLVAYALGQGILQFYCAAPVTTP